MAATTTLTVPEKASTSLPPSYLYAIPLSPLPEKPCTPSSHFSFYTTPSTPFPSKPSTLLQPSPLSTLPSTYPPEKISTPSPTPALNITNSILSGSKPSTPLSSLYTLPSTILPTLWLTQTLLLTTRTYALLLNLHLTLLTLPFPLSLPRATIYSLLLLPHLAILANILVDAYDYRFRTLTTRNLYDGAIVNTLCMAGASLLFLIARDSQGLELWERLAAAGVDLGFCVPFVVGWWVARGVSRDGGEGDEEEGCERMEWERRLMI